MNNLSNMIITEKKQRTGPCLPQNVLSHFVCVSLLLFCDNIPFYRERSSPLPPTPQPGVGVLLAADQFVWVSGLPLGPLTRFYLVLFSADNYLIILPKASSLTRKRVCSLQWDHSLVPITILYRLI
jgi:hypothetical protein